MVYIMVSTHTRTHTHTHIHIYSIYIYIHVHTYIYIQSYIYVYIHTHTVYTRYICVCIYKYTYLHLCIYTYIHIHTYLTTSWKITASFIFFHYTSRYIHHKIIKSQFQWGHNNHSPFNVPFFVNHCTTETIMTMIDLFFTHEECLIIS